MTLIHLEYDYNVNDLNSLRGWTVIMTLIHLDVYYSINDLDSFRMTLIHL